MAAGFDPILIVVDEPGEESAAIEVTLVKQVQSPAISMRDATYFLWAGAIVAPLGPHP